MRPLSRRVSLAALSLLAPSVMVAQRAAGGDSSLRAPSAQVADTRREAPAASKAPARRSTRRLATVFLVGAAVALPFDGRLERAMHVRELQSSGPLRSAAGVFNWLGGPGALALDAGALVVGRALGHQGLARAGLQGTEAIIVSGTIVAGLKTLAGRQRPYLSPDDADAFHPGRGLAGGRTSFPSGHAAAAFSAATVLGAQLGERWPGARPIVTPLLYAGATMVGLSRMYDSKHWASDVIVGAGIGTISAMRVLRWNGAHPDNRLARVLAGVSLAPANGRVALTWSPE